MKENRFTENKDLALTLCKKFLINSKFYKPKSKNKYALLRNIVERCHESGRYAGKLHKKEAKRKIKEKMRLEKKYEEEAKLQRRMALERQLNKFTK